MLLEARSARADARLCTSSGINLIVPLFFSPGEVGDCTKHWQVSPGDKEPGQLNHIETAV